MSLVWQIVTVIKTNLFVKENIGWRVFNIVFSYQISTKRKLRKRFPNIVIKEAHYMLYSYLINELVRPKYLAHWGTRTN